MINFGGFCEILDWPARGMLNSVRFLQLLCKTSYCPTNRYLINCLTWFHNADRTQLSRAEPVKEQINESITISSHLFGFCNFPSRPLVAAHRHHRHHSDGQQTSLSVGRIASLLAAGSLAMLHHRASDTSTSTSTSRHTHTPATVIYGRTYASIDRRHLLLLL